MKKLIRVSEGEVEHDELVVNLMTEESTNVDEDEMNQHLISIL